MSNKCTNPFYLKRNDTYPNLTVTIKSKKTGLPLDLTGITDADVKFSMVDEELTAKVDGEQGKVIDALNGKVGYEWNISGSDTDTAGNYFGEFEVTLAGRKFSVPVNKEELIIKILPDFDEL